MATGPAVSRAPGPRAGSGSIRVRREPLEALDALWPGPAGGPDWTCPFSLPPWLAAWARTLGRDRQPLVLVGRAGGRPVGVAPLSVEGDTARFLGDPDVCDWQDFAAAPGAGPAFCAAVLRHLRAAGVRRIELEALRPDAAALQGLEAAAADLGLACTREPAGVSVELALPRTWDAFLAGLGRKERHEIRRKLRRLHEAGCVEHVTVTGPGEAAGAMDRFLALFRASRADKAAFLTPEREDFFRAMALEMARAGMLELAFLEVDGTPAAATLCLGYRSTTYLYNNGYDPRFARLSVGLLSKVLSIRASIEWGRARYDLLKGAEPYKLRLGGREVPLARCRVDLQAPGSPEP